MSAPRWGELPSELRALLAGWKARKPRRVQRAEYRTTALAKAEANRRAFGAVRPNGAPPKPPSGGFLNQRGLPLPALWPGVAIPKGTPDATERTHPAPEV